MNWHSIALAIVLLREVYGSRKWSATRSTFPRRFWRFIGAA